MQASHAAGSPGGLPMLDRCNERRLRRNSGMRRSLTLAALAFGAPLAAPLVASAQTAEDGWKVDATVTFAGSAIDDDTQLAPAGDGLLASGLLSVTRTDTFDNGLQLIWRGGVRVDRDAATRPAFAGVLGDCPAANVLCPRATDGVSFFSPISPATGLAADGALAEEDVFAAVEVASLSIEGGWGEGIIGFDSGAAAQLDARPPTVMQRVSSSSSG